MDGGPVQGSITYEVARATGTEGASRTITTAPVADTAFTDRGLVNDQAYAYTVRALRTDAGGRARGAPSSPVMATPIDLTPPAPPRDLVAVVTAGDVRLSWVASADPDVARYVVYRADSRGTFTRAGSTVPPATTFVDRAVPTGTYRYVVTAHDRQCARQRKRPLQCGRRRRTLTSPGANARLYAHMEPFAYHHHELSCESVSLRALADAVGTPAYVYSSAALRDRYDAYARAFADLPHLICYAVKANANLGVISTLARAGAGADIVSGGELYRALRAGVPPARSSSRVWARPVTRCARR